MIDYTQSLLSLTKSVAVDLPLDQQQTECTTELKAIRITVERDGSMNSDLLTYCCTY